MVTVEDDRALAGNVIDGPSDPIDKDTFDDRNSSKVNDGFNVDGGSLAGERNEPSRSTTGELVAYFSTFR
jgi:hypothetical protein